MYVLLGQFNDLSEVSYSRAKRCALARGIRVPVTAAGCANGLVYAYFVDLFKTEPESTTTRHFTKRSCQYKVSYYCLVHI